eukprot:COSAG02_NODE_53733_length_300_cov_0.646766_1_plen_60_part_00
MDAKAKSSPAEEGPEQAVDQAADQKKIDQKWRSTSTAGIHWQMEKKKDRGDVRTLGLGS